MHQYNRQEQSQIIIVPVVLLDIGKA